MHVFTRGDCTVTAQRVLGNDAHGDLPLQVLQIGVPGKSRPP
jgi:hypothetical protein